MHLGKGPYRRTAKPLALLALWALLANPEAVRGQEEPSPPPPPAPPSVPTIVTEKKPHRVNTVFRGRFERRDEVFRRTGSRSFGKESEQAVADALDWLRRHQDPGGAWECSGFGKMCPDAACGGRGAPPYTVGVTGLALLAFLGTGDADARPGPNQDAVRRGLAYLLSVQRSDGCYVPNPTAKFLYLHAAALEAVAEGAALTGSPELRRSARKGAAFAVAAQNPGLGWRYGVRPQDNDTSVTGWVALALEAAGWAGEAVPPEALQGARTWFDRVTEPEFGRVGYTAQGNGPARPQEFLEAFPPDRTESLTALAAAVRLLGGDPSDSALAARGCGLLRRTLPTWSKTEGAIDLYYWNYGSLALFQAGGGAWDAWQKALVPALVGSQVRDRESHAFGSWEPADPWGPEGGRVYATAMAAMALESPYRFARVSESPPDRTRLTLRSDPPGAVVSHPGTGDLGLTPLVDVPVPPGEATLRLRHPACTDRDLAVDLAPLERNDLGTATLAPGAPVNLALLPPGASVFHEGRRLREGDTVRPGAARLLVVQPQCWTLRVEVEAKAGEAVALPDPASAGKAPLWSGAAWSGIPAPPRPEAPLPALPKGFREIEGRIWCDRDGAEMVLVPPRPDGKVPALLVDRCEITVAQFRRFCSDSKARMPAQPTGHGNDHPVVNVTPADASAYARWAGKRLPDSEEWSWCSRGGMPWPWGDLDCPEARVLPGGPKPPVRPEKVGSLPGGMNAFGLLDAYGNVAEWCTRSFATPSACGGGWRNATLARSGENAGLPDVGFRCVQAPGR